MIGTGAVKQEQCEGGEGCACAACMKREQAVWTDGLRYCKSHRQTLESVETQLIFRWLASSEINYFGFCHIFLFRLSTSIFLFKLVFIIDYFADHFQNVRPRRQDRPESSRFEQRGAAPTPWCRSRKKRTRSALRREKPDHFGFLPQFPFQLVLRARTPRGAAPRPPREA